MIIHSMTATFGKLAHQTLTLTPGLNVIEAHNEWGKSTWCAFLVSMLYGIDTRARSTGTALADKERYAPWSGAPMSGRIELTWDGRDITIERRTRGRVIFGDFKAYETATGIDVPELNANNCGQLLLGVERSVFTRAGFLRFSDLPVTQDDSLRRRLNNLVTTGDESGAGDKLGQQLKDLKNKCRYNRSGLLPQAEAEREQLKNQLHDLQSLSQQAQQLQEAQAEMEAHIRQLENHEAALTYQASLADAKRVAQAEADSSQAQAQLARLLAVCREKPPMEQTRNQLRQAQQLQEALLALQMETQLLPPMPQAPQAPAHYRDITPEEAIAQAQADVQTAQALEKNRRFSWFAFLLPVLAATILVLGFQSPWYLYPIAALVGIAVCVWRVARLSRKLAEVNRRHPGLAVDAWVADAQAWSDALLAHRAQADKAQALRGDLEERTAQLQQRIDQLTDGASMAERVDQWSADLADWDALGDARRDAQRCEAHLQALRAMAHAAEPPTQPDTLTYTQQENQALLTEARLKLRQLHTRLGQCQGQTEALGSEALLRARLDTLNRRIARLEDTYYALELAQDALHSATTQLQRRFAPRISRRAQELFGKLTGGRYTRLTLEQDLSVSTSAADEDTLRTAQWRSDGTTDQLYLALRLAVAQELTPDAPLILDDTLVRFDDQRLAAAMALLKEEARHRQVILFTCQNREKAYMELEETL